MTAQANYYDIVADFLASMDPSRILELHAPEAMQKRLEDLIEKEKESGLAAEEKDELDHYIVLERLIRLAKANAHLRLSKKIPEELRQQVAERAAYCCEYCRLPEKMLSSPFRLIIS